MILLGTISYQLLVISHRSPKLIQSFYNDFWVEKVLRTINSGELYEKKKNTFQNIREEILEKFLFKIWWGEEETLQIFQNL